MSQAQPLMPRFDDVPSFNEWTAGQPGDWELHDGIPVAMAPEHADHARIKLQACLALRNALRDRALRCEALIDGLMVPVSSDIRNPAVGDIENPATLVTLMPRPAPVRWWI